MTLTCPALPCMGYDALHYVLRISRYQRHTIIPDCTCITVSCGRCTSSADTLCFFLSLLRTICYYYLLLYVVSPLLSRLPWSGCLCPPTPFPGRAGHIVWVCAGWGGVGSPPKCDVSPGIPMGCLEMYCWRERSHMILLPGCGVDLGGCYGPQTSEVVVLHTI